MKAAIYCRLSEEDRHKEDANADSNSIQNQKSMLLQYAGNHGWEIFDIYSDDDYTGSDRRRPQFNRLLADAKAHKFDIILCKTQSRFTRELEMVEKYIHGLLPQWGIRFISIVDNADTANKGNKKSRQINGLVNEWYLEDMSENIRSVLTNRRMQGLHIGAFAPYGYQKDSNRKGHLIIDPEAALVIQEIFALFSQGFGKTAIARQLNDRRVPNPTEYKRLCGMQYQNSAARNSTLWSYSSISGILNNEIYIGNMVQGRYGSISYKSKACKPRGKAQWIIVENTHEPIICQELWDRVQSLLKQKARPYSNGKTGVFAGIAKCAYCGSTMRSSKNRGRHYLQCQTRYIASDACIGAFIPVAELERTVLCVIKMLSSEFLEHDLLKRNIVTETTQNTQIALSDRNLAEYQNRIRECSKSLKALYMDKLRSIITEEEYFPLAKEITGEKCRLEGLLQTEQENRMLLEKAMAEENPDSRIEDYLNPEHLSRPMVEALIKQIRIGRRDPKTGDVPIEIYWNF